MTEFEKFFYAKITPVSILDPKANKTKRALLCLRLHTYIEFLHRFVRSRYKKLNSGRDGFSVYDLSPDKLIRYSYAIHVKLSKYIHRYVNYRYPQTITSKDRRD